MKNIFRVVKISKPLYPIIALLAFLIVVGVVINLIVPLLSKAVVDQIVAQIQNKNGNVHSLIFFIVPMFVLQAVGTVISSLSDRLGDHFAGRLRQFLTEKFYYKVLSLPQSYYDTEISGKILNQLNRGISTIQQFMNTATNFIIPTFLQSILTIAVMAYYSVPVAIFTSFLFPVYLLISYYSSKQWGKIEVKKNTIEVVTRGRIQEVISNIKLVKSFNTEHTEYTTISHNLTDINKLYAVQSSTFHFLDFLRNFSLVLIFTAAGVVIFYSTFQGKLTIGAMVLLIQLLAQARLPLFAMSFILTQIQMAESGSKEFFEILELPSKENFSKNFDTEKVKTPTLEFKNVSFKYETSNMILKDISFKIGHKEQVALVGHSGVGKTTLINLILKFYEPTQGDILMKDKNYKDLDHRFIRNNIALVFQESELFSSTIRENVAYGTLDAKEEDIIKALKLANAYDFVMKLPKGIDSEVGERGVRLSGGQKQRVQIARAIMKNSPILILDEATSSLDSKSEAEVQEGIKNLMKDKLVIIIAHRFSTIQHVNKILVIDEGQVTDSGSPQELSGRPGIYRDLLHYQVEGNKKLLASFDIY
jgi:ATP-binding cassette subfamily B protein